MEFVRGTPICVRIVPVTRYRLSLLESEKSQSESLLRTGRGHLLASVVGVACFGVVEFDVLAAHLR